MQIRFTILLHVQVVGGLLFFLSRQDSACEALQTSHHRPPPRPLRRQRPFKVQLPLPLISGLVAALNQTNPLEALKVFGKVAWEEARSTGTNEALPIAHWPCSDLRQVSDCVAAQQEFRQVELAPFLLELTPPPEVLARVDDSPAHSNDDEETLLKRQDAECRWLHDNAAHLQELKRRHGAVYLKSWSTFGTLEGIQKAQRALGNTPCRDPKEIRGGGILSDRTQSNILYETLNHPDDADTHLGLHTEGIPGIYPSSALFCCRQAAESGGEFLLADGRRIFRDLRSTTLQNLETTQLRPTFAQLPPWLATLPPPLSWLPFCRELYRQVLSLFVEMTSPTDDFMLDVFPEGNETSLKLTTHPTVPVIHHPVTREPVFWSGMDAGHRGNFQRDNPHLLKQQQGSNKGKYASEVFDVRYGNGAEISEMDLRNVKEACDRHTVALQLQPGDAIFLDNFMTYHGRKPFQGTRKHTVVWFLD